MVVVVIIISQSHSIKLKEKTVLFTCNHNFPYKKFGLLLITVNLIIIYLFPTTAFSYNLFYKNIININNLQYIKITKNINSHTQLNINFPYSHKIYCFTKKNTFKNNFPVIVNNYYTSIYKKKHITIFRINTLFYNILIKIKYTISQIYPINQSSQLLLSQYSIIINNKIPKNLQKIENLFIIKNQYSKFTLKYPKFKILTINKFLTKINKITHTLATIPNCLNTALFHSKTDFTQHKYNFNKNVSHILRNQLLFLKDIKTNQPHINSKIIIKEEYNKLPQSIKKQLHINQDLSLLITQQIQDMNNITDKQKEIEKHILQVNQTFSNLVEQSQWINKSPALGETLRSQVSALPKIPKFQQLDNDMAQLRAQRLQYENYMNKIPSISLLQNVQDDGTSLTSMQKQILDKQLHIQRQLIISILNNYDTQILELTKLKLSYEELKNVLQKIQQATHRYLFWVADVHPINLSYPIDVYQDILKLITNSALHEQMRCALHMIFTNQKTLIPTIFCILMSLILHLGIRRHYYKFLDKTSKYIGKVNHDNFLITFYTICNSILISLPIPILWVSIGYNFSHSWPYPIIVSIGEAMYTTTFMLWTCIISYYFASPQGLFIIHFGWSKKKIQKIFSKNYTWLVSITIFFATSLTIFNNYNNREFSNSLGRLCFLILCISLIYITYNLKNSELPLYLNKYDSSNNIINQSLWNIMISAPIIAAISSTFGYLFAAQTLLMKLETSLLIWIVLLIIYQSIRRWMFIQRRRIAFERAKKKRKAQLIFRSYNESNQPTQPLITKKQLFSDENNKKILDLDTISAQSLQLTKSIITLIALLLMTVLWSELRFAFSFLDNIILWDITSIIKGLENTQPITLNSLLTVIVVIIITTITVRNLPSFLELTLLQYLNLTPGTGYAITTLTKYILMLLGGLIGFSLIGIEWVKIQWLIAALGVGLGFGLQEIFANFISGLIILFEKPIRIGDTITIQNLTGSVTKINTRATIITDWDHKEIIVPNKEFITKQFINWSLSNTITRVILRIPTPPQIETKKMATVLMNIIKNSSLALDIPTPEVYLIDLQHGLPIFEIRIHTADIKSRIPLRHQINTGLTEYYKDNALQPPCLPLFFYKEPTTTEQFTSFDNQITNSNIKPIH